MHPQLVRILPFGCSSPFKVFIFKAEFLIAFFGLALWEYMLVWPKGQVMLLIHEDGLLLKRFEVTGIFRKEMGTTGSWAEHFAPHPFWTGAASAAAAAGWPPADIQATGRWQSGSFKNYVRP